MEITVPLVTELTRRFALRCPIVSAPMGAAAGGRLAAAVTRAGGLGMIGVGHHDAAWVEARPSAVMLSFGDAAPFVPAIRRAGLALILQVQRLAAAPEGAALEPDLMAQGTEVGGHGAARALFPLLPALVDAVGPVPVLAAGGIGDGRGLVAALALGAAGVLIGTRFYAAEESLASPAVKQRLVAGGGDDTLRTEVFEIVRELPWPAPFTGRAIRNGFSARWHGREAELRGPRPDPGRGAGQADHHPHHGAGRGGAVGAGPDLGWPGD